jgi:hypothetical protein
MVDAGQGRLGAAADRRDTREVDPAPRRRQHALGSPVVPMQPPGKQLRDLRDELRDQ